MKKKVDVQMLMFAILVVLMFIGVGLAIAYRSIIGILLFLILGFSIFGWALVLKRRKRK